jgi:seryl-tRNA synthetase
MLDIKWIRENPEDFDAAMKRRGISEPGSLALLKFDSSRREVQTALQEKQGLRNDLSKEIGVLKGKGEEAEAEKCMAQVVALKDEMQALEEARTGTERETRRPSCWAAQYSDRGRSRRR